MSLTERDVHRNINRSFIERAPSYISLFRSAVVDDGAGGKVLTTPEKLTAQKVRVVGQPRIRTTMTSDGRQVVIDLALVGQWNFDVMLGDTFEVAGKTYEVVNIQDQPKWRTIAEAIRRG